MPGRQAGRAFGPMFASLVYDFGTRLLGRRAGANISFSYLIVMVAFAMLLPMWNFRKMYGGV